jgi:hypothetical protein
MIILVSVLTVLPFFFLIHLRTGLMCLQLSRMRVIGTRFTVFVMVRVVRLTIETNALTGRLPFTQPCTDVHLTRVATFEPAWPLLASYSKSPSPYVHCKNRPVLFRLF